MPATALLKFAQGSNVGNNGRALIVTAGTSVTISNSNNADVQSYRIELLYAPPDSSMYIIPGIDVPTVLAQGNGVPSAALTPEVGIHGTYRIRLTVWSGPGYSGQSDVDIRCFSVPTPNKLFVKPPYQKFPDPLPLEGEGKAGEKPDELNFQNQRWGWSGPGYYAGTSHPFRLLNAIIEELDSAGSGSGSLVTSSAEGTVAQFPNGYLRILLSDGSTPGGVWRTITSSNAGDLIAEGAIPLVCLEEGDTAGEFLYWTGTAWETRIIPLLPTATHHGQMLYWSAGISSWVPCNQPPANGAIMTYESNQPMWDLAGTSGVANIGQLLYWDGSNERWSVSTAPPSTSARYAPTFFGGSMSWQSFGGTLPSGTTQGQILYWDATAGEWMYTDNSSAVAGMTVVLNASNQPIWVSAAAASLVSSTVPGNVNAFPDSASYLFASDGATAGGIWVRSLNPYVNDGSLDVVKLYGESTYYYLLTSYGNYAVWRNFIEDLRTASFHEEYSNGNSGTAKTINWTVAQKQSVTLTDNCTFTFTAPRGPCNLMLRLRQDSTGSRTITWPSSSRASGGTILLGQEANTNTVVGIYYDGTNYFLTSTVNVPDSQATTVLV
jgi:hypothetical protein